jgi:hypothetical protein
MTRRHRRPLRPLQVNRRETPNNGVECCTRFLTRNPLRTSIRWSAAKRDREGSPTPAHRHRHPFAPYRFFAEMASFALRFRPTRVMNRRAPTKRRKDSPTMTNAEATTTENAATVAEQGAHVAPEKASSYLGRNCSPPRREARLSRIAPSAQAFLTPPRMLPPSFVLVSRSPFFSAIWNWLSREKPCSM